jgi:hypothetical protein
MIPPGPPSGRQVRIADIRVLPTDRSGMPGAGRPRLRAGEPFRLRFTLQVGARSPDSGVTSWFDVDVRACRLGGATTWLLASDRIGAVSGGTASTVELAVPGLEPGQYRLLTLVTFGAATEVAAFHDGPVVTVRARRR